MPYIDITERKLISVWAIIVNYNTGQECCELFQNLKQNKNFNIHILIIDNNSSIADRTILKNNIPKNNLILNDTNEGYAVANNFGIEKALRNKADYIWILNPDIRVDANTLEGLVYAINKSPKTAAAGVRILKRENPDYIFSDGEKMSLEGGCDTFHKNHDRPVKDCATCISYDVDYIDGSCIFISAEAIQEIGGLPEEYFLYFEETHWCKKAIDLGWKLVINSNVSAYNLTSKKGKVFHYYFSRNKLLFCKKNDINYKNVRSQSIFNVLNEMLKILKGEKPTPFLKDRIKGVLAGIYKAEFKT
jgi:GT2 family glycosyltransferase